MLHPLAAQLAVSQYRQTEKVCRKFRERALLFVAGVCVRVCFALCVRARPVLLAAEWGHIWLQLLILPDAFAMMCLSAPGNPLNVFIQAACLYTHSLCAHFVGFASCSSGLLKSFFKHSWAQNSLCCSGFGELATTRPSSNSFLCKLSRTGIPTSSQPLPLSQHSAFSPERKKRERGRVMMQCAAISRHCVMLLALLSFLEFPPFFSCWSHFTRDTRRRSGNELQVSQTVHIHQKATIPRSHEVSSSFPGYEAAPGTDGWAGCFPLCWWLALAGPSLAAVVDQASVM